MIFCYTSPTFVFMKGNGLYREDSMASYNRVIMMGNLTRDPEHRQLASGQSVCRFGIASNRQFKNKQTGAMVQEVCFIDVDVWGAQADSCNQYLQKGRQVLIEGRLKFDTWEDNEGNRRSKHSIVADRVTFLSSGASDDVGQEESPSSTASSSPADAVKASASQESADEMNKVASQNPDDQQQMSASTGEITFKDEKPFEDDLPF